MRVTLAVGRQAQKENTMTDFEKLQYAWARLGLVRMMGDKAEE